MNDASPRTRIERQQGLPRALAVAPDAGSAVVAINGNQAVCSACGGNEIVGEQHTVRSFAVNRVEAPAQTGASHTLLLQVSSQATDRVTFRCASCAATLDASQHRTRLAVCL